MNEAPGWQDGECCFRCRTQFSLVARKHHCRNCGNIFCAKCSSQQIPLPKLNIEKNVRVCDICYEKVVGKNDDPLTMALSKDTQHTKPKLATSKSSSSSSSKNNMSAASASAPSEQELKEEEEFQLALALSLSETPTKAIFPEVRSYEDQKSVVKNYPATTASLSETNLASNHPLATNGTASQSAKSSQPDSAIKQDYPAVSQPHMPAMEYNIPERDREVFRFVGEVHSNLEVFTNRLESCKLRARPVANDAAIQSLFIRLNSEVQPKLAEYIKTYDEERADYERIQDKLSQIADARAALDALREEHQEKMREQAAEAERLRQTQLATKLEAMRQKKSEMMQYQRELALQRIKEQEMMSQHPQYQTTTTQAYQVPAVPHKDSFVSQSAMNQTGHDWYNQNRQLPEQQHSHVQSANYVPTQQHYVTPNNHVTQIPQQQYVPPSTQPAVPASVETPHQAPSIDRASIAQLERQFLPPSKPDEDTPLISFDD